MANHAVSPGARWSWKSRRWSWEISGIQLYVQRGAAFSSLGFNSNAMPSEKRIFSSRMQSGAYKDLQVAVMVERLPDLSFVLPEAKDLPLNAQRVSSRYAQFADTMATTQSSAAADLAGFVVNVDGVLEFAFADGIINPADHFDANKFKTKTVAANLRKVAQAGGKIPPVLGGKIEYADVAGADMAEAVIIDFKPASQEWLLCFDDTELPDRW